MSENQSSHLNKDVQDNKIFGILAYFGILFLVPLLAAKDSPFARFHANQGIILFIVCIIAAVVMSILTAVVVFISSMLVTLFGILSWLVYLGLFILTVIGIINAAQGQKKELPLIGNLFHFVK